MVVSGLGKTKLFISGADTFTVLQVDPGVAAVISGITIEQEYSTYPAGGGGINNRGTRALTQTSRPSGRENGLTSAVGSDILSVRTTVIQSSPIQLRLKIIKVNVPGFSEGQG